MIPRYLHRSPPWRVLALFAAAWLGCSDSGRLPVDAPAPDAETEPPAVTVEQIGPAQAPEPSRNAERRPRERNYLAEVEQAVAVSRREISLPREEVERIKAATALVLTRAGSGTGFVFEEIGGRLLLLTNYHVIQSAPEAVGQRVRVVFDGGTERVTVEEATVVAVDAEADLAILSVPQHGQRAALRLADDGEAFETQPVLAVGFPFGTFLGDGEFPAPTFSRGAVSSLRRNSARELARIQIDADLNPGNSGGPVLNGRGEVLGVAVSGIETTDISFIVPARMVEHLLEGTIESVNVQAIQLGERLLATIVVATGDPLERITRVGIDALPEGLPSSPQAREVRDTLASATRPGSTTSLQIEVPEPGPQGTVLLRPWYENRLGRQDLPAFRLAHRASHAFQTVYAAGDLRTDQPIVLDPIPSAHEWHLEPDAQPGWEALVHVPASGVVEPLPGGVRDVRMAGGGRYLVLRVGTSTLAVFNLVSLRVESLLPVDSYKFLFAAGGDMILTYRPEIEAFEVTDLHTRQRRMLANPFPGEVLVLVMGKSNGRTALVRWKEPVGHWSRWSLLDLRTGRSGDLSIEPERCRNISRIWSTDYHRARASADLSRFVVYSRQATSLDLAVYEIDGDRAECEMADPRIIGNYSLAESGWLFGSGWGKSLVLTPDLQVFEEYGFKNALFADPAGVFYVRVCLDGSKGFVSELRSTSSHEPLVPLDLPPEWFPPPSERHELPLSDRMLLLPEARALVAFPSKKAEIVVRRLDLERLLERSTAPYLLLLSRPPTRARRGSTYSYRIRAKSQSGQISYVLEVGPKDMRIDGLGRLTWDVPPGLVEDQRVTLRISDRDRNVRYQSFNIRIE